MGGIGSSSSMVLTALRLAYSHPVVHALPGITDFVKMVGCQAPSPLVVVGVKRCCYTNNSSSAFPPISAMSRLFYWSRRQWPYMPSYAAYHVRVSMYLL